MAAFSIVIQTGEVVEVLTLIETAFNDPTPLMRDVLLIMIRSTQVTFQEQGRPGKWAELAQSTIDARIRRQFGSTRTKANFARQVGSGHQNVRSGRRAVAFQTKYFHAVGTIQILRDRGLLLQSVGGNASGAFEAEGGFGEADKHSAIIGTNRPGADALQLGNPARGLPPRVFLLFQVQDEVDIADIGIAFVLQVGPYEGKA